MTEIMTGVAPRSTFALAAAIMLAAMVAAASAHPASAQTTKPLSSAAASTPSLPGAAPIPHCRPQPATPTIPMPPTPPSNAATTSRRSGSPRIAPRTKATPRRCRCWANSMPAAWACRRTTPKPPSGTSSPPTAATAKRCSRWACSGCRAAAVRATATPAPNGSPPPPSSAIRSQPTTSALLYIEGQLFPQDFSRAAELLRIAATAGNPEAQYALGTLYKQGRGVPKDMKEAVRLWALASIADNTDARSRIRHRALQWRWHRQERTGGRGVVSQGRAARQRHRAGSAGAHPRRRPRRAERPGRGGEWHLISKAHGETDLTLDDFVASRRPDPRRRRESRQALSRRDQAPARGRRGVAAPCRRTPPGS